MDSNVRKLNREIRIVESQRERDTLRHKANPIRTSAMTQDTQVLQTKLGVRALCIVIYIVGVALLSIHLPFGIASRHRIWIVPIYALFGALWLADIFMKRIVLTKDGLRIVSVATFRSRTVPRIEIESVTWEKGCGASIKLRNGTWVRLPDVGRNAQGLTNTIRAWLNKTA
jgi:hypothetical protein